jgi:hypothetical protein
MTTDAPRLANPQRRLIGIAAQTRKGTTALEAFHALYATSRQQATKVRGIWNQLDKMRRDGLMVTNGTREPRYSAQRFYPSTEGYRAAVVWDSRMAK